MPKKILNKLLYPFLPSRDENLPPQFPCLGVTVKFSEVRIAKFCCSVLLTPPNGFISRSFSISLNYRYFSEKPLKNILPEKIFDIVFCITKSFLDSITSSSGSDQSVSSGNSFHSIMLRQTFSTPIGNINPTGNRVNIPTKVSQKPIINWNKGVNQLTPDRTLIPISILTDLHTDLYLTDEKNII